MVGFIFCSQRGLPLATFTVMSPRSQSDQRANKLQPKLKQLSVVLTTVDTAEQEVGRGECTEAIGDAYANGAVGHERRVFFFCLLAKWCEMGFEPQGLWPFEPSLWR